ncbi:MAG: pyruvate kinase [Chitinophagales bacterium]
MTKLHNRTKIVSTLGPASESKEMIRQLIKEGVSIFRLNFSHGSHEEHAKRIVTIKEVNAELGTNIGILADLQGPKIRLGKDVEGGKTRIESGSVVTLTTKNVTTTSTVLYIKYDDFAKDITAGDRVLIDDGKLQLSILSTNGVDEAKAKVIHGGQVKPRKGVNLPDTEISIPSLTTKDRNDLPFILTQDVNWIALSFVRSADDIHELRALINEKNHPAKIIAKIEKPEAIEHLDSIIKATDGVMVARGDLGIEVPMQKVPILQKRMIRKCLRASKPVIVATQMLDSMERSPTPTRAEVTDVANGIFEGADAVMSSGETAAGDFPALVVNTFSKIIAEVETQDSIFYRDVDTVHDDDNLLISDAVCDAACSLAQTLDAKAIIAMTRVGTTAHHLSSNRPKAHIYAFTENKELVNKLNLLWGVKAFHYDKSAHTDEVINDTQKILQELGYIESGDIVINTGNLPRNQAGRTNTIKVTRVE